MAFDTTIKSVSGRTVKTAAHDSAVAAYPSFMHNRTATDPPEVPMKFPRMLWLVVGTCLATSFAADSGASPDGGLKPVTVAAFKNGLAFVVRQGDLTLEDGEGRIAPIPAANLSLLTLSLHTISKGSQPEGEHSLSLQHTAIPLLSPYTHVADEPHSKPIVCPRPPQTRAAPFKSLYRKRAGQRLCHLQTGPVGALPIQH